ncbi:hypothetical protein [Actinoplanes flavus]|uniref:Uncharacterized protein n=1 Tax=Actinoplanes flavus TaxID=2820290 RepID=A0ABS3US20_9ACTN|nr:hypothetical protein [Actinoplanes flavus]MBO3741372.1 hypothetical protein [Actinoplanes flavus]
MVRSLALLGWTMGPVPPDFPVEYLIWWRHDRESPPPPSTALLPLRHPEQIDSRPPTDAELDLWVRLGFTPPRE